MMTPAQYERLMATLAQAAQHALALYGIGPDATVDLLSYSENATFRVVVPADGARLVVRVHRPDYHSRNAIRSELAWMAALNEAGIGTPQALPGLDGDTLQEIAVDGLGARNVVVFHWIDGRFPDETELEDSMHRLGHLSARMHAHSRSWRRPPYFERLIWDHDGTVGENAYWGRWEQSPGLAQDHLPILQRAQLLLRARLEAFGKSEARFGLIHADQRLANLLVDGDKTHIIDFDDCGLGWYLHDLAAALSFIEHRPTSKVLIARWLEGYSSVATLSQAEVDEIPTFIMQRRLQLLAWRGSHFETDMARTLGDDWVEATVQMGARYLRDMS